MTQSVFRGIKDMVPLSVAVIPWGVLCGALAMELGLSVWQAQAMSLLIFAGAVQLAFVGGYTGPPSAIAMLNSSLVISSRHLLYSAVMRQHVITLPWYKRAIFAFVLTDEMFALSQKQLVDDKQFDYGYALSSGFMFYVSWNLATLAGIIIGNSIPNLEHFGFEFAVAATFIALVVPMVKDKPMVLAVTVSAAVALVYDYLSIANGLIVATFSGMLAGFISSEIQLKGKDNG
ncbi:AzlC family ABC transporter permease [Paraferrimonas sp. SM1919]|uniref:AzlC family ABC transporter permease n=1 Tax=Paraferrimonas sp. SM1919 TaxID=2662263 RepID=UPI0013D56F39|nr:AzlC family ABC transporter permease [Paraferrimonas sp. SM1919]